MGSRTGVGAGTKDGYEMLKVSRDEIQRDSPKIPAPVKNSGDLQILENAIGSCNTVTKVILSALSTGLHLTGAGRFENSHRNERPSTTTVRVPFHSPDMSMLYVLECPLMLLSALHDALPPFRPRRPEPRRPPEAH